MGFHLKIEIRNSTAIGIAKTHHYRSWGFLTEFYLILYEKKKKDKDIFKFHITLKSVF